MPKANRGRISIDRFGEVLIASRGVVHRTGWALVDEYGRPMGLTRARLREVSGLHILNAMTTGCALVRARTYQPSGGMPLWGIEFLGPVVSLPVDSEWRMTRARFEELTGWAAPPAAEVTGIRACTDGAVRPREDYGRET